MNKLHLAINRCADPDAVYRLLIDAHRSLNDAQSAAFNARLVLLLANQIGDIDVLRQALEVAGSVERPSSAAQ